MTEQPPTVTDLDVGKLYQRYIVMVRGRALRILGNLAIAEDVAQEVFIRYLRHRKRGNQEEHTGGLLYRMVTNLSLNTLRDAKRRRELLEGHRREQSGQPASPEEQLALRQVLAAVPLELATIASYYYVDGMEQDEIAEFLSLERRTIGRRLERFRERARRLLGLPPPRGET